MIFDRIMGKWCALFCSDLTVDFKVYGGIFYKPIKKNGHQNKTFFH